MFISATSILVFAIGFLFLFSWMRFKLDAHWGIGSIVASSCICAIVATFLLSLLMGTILFVLSMASAWLIMVAIVIGGVSLTNRLARKRT